MNNSIRELLRQYAVAPDNNSDSHTHLSMYGPHARWTVYPQSQQHFWKGYCDLVAEAEESGDDLADFCLAERATELMPVIGKFTFRFGLSENTEDWEPFDEDLLMHIAEIYQRVIRENFVLLMENSLELVAVILESSSHWFEEDAATKERQLVYEVRIQFPYCKVYADVQNRVIRSRVIKALRDEAVINKLPKTPLGTWETILSEKSVNEALLMFGSSEISGRPKLRRSHIWAELTPDMMAGLIEPYEYPIEDAFSPRNHLLCHQQPHTIPTFDHKPPEHWFPMFLSINHWTSIVSAKEGVDVNAPKTMGSSKIIAPPTPNSSHTFGTKSSMTQQYSDDIDTIELAETMASMLSSDRFIKEAFWLDIGKALYASNLGSDNGLMSWIRHTIKALNILQILPDFLQLKDNGEIPNQLLEDKLSEEDQLKLLRETAVREHCQNLYYTFESSHVTVNTLAWYAREDSPDRYSNWHRDWCMASMEQALSCSHTDVAVALRKVYWLDFAYCPIGKGVWFQFKNHRWAEVNQGIQLRKIISSDFVRRFELIRAQLSTNITITTDEAVKANGELALKKLSMLIMKLKTVGFKSCIMTEATEQFVNDRFISLLNRNENLTGVTNGVLECIGDHIVHRTAKPEDYVSKCANVPFHAHYNWKHPLVEECMKWMGEVFTDKQLKHHFLKFSASCLRGRNSDKIFPIFSGSGHNSKSMIIKLFEATFNSYCIKFPVSLLTEKGGNSSGPTPQLARAKDARVAFLDEPEDDVPMAKGTIKRFTGGDSFFARLLQDNGGDVEATFKMILVCNNVPLITNPDSAIKDRTKIFPFLSTWVKEPPADYEEQIRQRRFKMNRTFESRIPILAPAFLWIMTQYFPYYVKEGLPDPEIVTETTEKYWRENDVYAQFAADVVQDVYTSAGDRDSNAKVTLSEIYTEFKTWFRDSFPGTKVPSRSDVRAELSSRWGRMHGTSWHGIRIVVGEVSTDLSASLRTGVKAASVKPAATPQKLVDRSLEKETVIPPVNLAGSPVNTRSPGYGKVII